MKKVTVIIIAYFISLMYPAPGQCTAVQDYWLKTVVLIEQEAKNEKGQPQILPIGTGFLLQSQKGYFYVVTCKHVVKNKDGSNKEGMFYRLNTKPPVSDAFDRIPINSLLKKMDVGYFLHSDGNVDIAVFPAAVNIEREDIQFITLNKFQAFDKVSTGEDIFVIGHPAGTVSGGRNLPVLRKGIVAFKNSDFACLIDSVIFPGDSGSPVITESLPFTYNKGTFNTKEVKRSQLIGMVSQQIRYQEPAISPQTGNVRVVFEENAGLSTIVASNFIEDVLGSEALKRYEEKENKPKEGQR